MFEPTYKLHVAGQRVKPIYTLHVSGWHVDNTDMRCLILLGYGMSLTGRDWSITPQYEFDNELHSYTHGTDPVPLPPTF